MEILKAVSLLIIISIFANPVYAQGASVLAPSENFDEDTCYDCHAAEEDSELSDPANDWADSIHAENEVTCERCHAASVPAGRLAKFGDFGGSYRDDHADVTLDTVDGEYYKAPSAYGDEDSNGEYSLVVQKGLSKQQIIVICARCHGLTPLDAENPKDVFPEFKEDVHGAGIMLGLGDPERMATLGIEAPDGEDVAGCTDCHDAHNTVSLAELSKKESLNSCAGGTLGEDCHSSDAIAEKYDFANAYDTYQDTHHGKALSLGQEDVAVCSDCHMSHGVMRADDPESTINSDNMADTCGQDDCHGATLSVATGSMHMSPKVGDVSVSGLIKLFYTILIPGAVGFFGIYVVTDFIKSISGKGGE